MKRGFTLIELLAVLTVLSIIMLITVPVVAGIIKNSKEKTREQSVELYGRAIENAINTYYVKYPLKNEVTLETLETEKLIDYKGTEVKCNIVRIEERDVYLEDCKVGNKKVDATYGKYIPETATDDDYRGYYADIDGDGNPDGIIYADLNKSESGAWGQSYSYNKATGELNEYTISKEKYTGKKAKFGENKIIKLKKKKDNPRFYVMALEDFTTEAYTDPNDSNNNYPAYTTYSWYKNAYDNTNHRGRMPDPAKDTSTDFGTGYANTGTMIRIWNNNGEEEGWIEGATQDKRDIWKHIKDKYNSKEKWYIPSMGEWAAFADYFTNNERVETKLTTSNYSTFGLSGSYWSSSQSGTCFAWFAAFYGNVYKDAVDRRYCVRLGVTF